jgi:hypothetical protein
MREASLAIPRATCRCVGPEHAMYITLVASLDPTEARNDKFRITLGVKL